MSAQTAGALATGTNAKDAARYLVALTQGMALMGRVTPTAAVPRSVVRAALRAMRA